MLFSASLLIRSGYNQSIAAVFDITKGSYPDVLVLGVFVDRRETCVAVAERC